MLTSQYFDLTLRHERKHLNVINKARVILPAPHVSRGERERRGFKCDTKKCRMTLSYLQEAQLVFKQRILDTIYTTLLL